MTQPAIRKLICANIGSIALVLGFFLVPAAIPAAELACTPPVWKP